MARLGFGSACWLISVTQKSSARVGSVSFWLGPTPYQESINSAVLFSSAEFEYNDFELPQCVENFL